MSSATHSKVLLSRCWGPYSLDAGQIQPSRGDCGVVQRWVSGTVVSDLVSESRRDLGGFNNDPPYNPGSSALVAAGPPSLQELPQLHQATRSAADNRIRQQNGADEYLQGPCLGKGAA